MKLRDFEEAKATVASYVEDAEFCLAIVLKDSSKVIGQIEAHPESSQPDGAENFVKDTFSPCWMLNKDYHGKGYAYEAAHAFFDYLFRQKGARRIYAYTEDYNLSSQHLCQKLGMRQEGFFREFVSFVSNPDGTPLYENTMQYAILKKEWLEHTYIDQISRPKSNAIIFLIGRRQMNEGLSAHHIIFHPPQGCGRTLSGAERK